MTEQFPALYTDKLAPHRPATAPEAVDELFEGGEMMGAYTDSLYRNRQRGPKPKVYNGERLTAAAIVRDGVTLSGGERSHAAIRCTLGDEDPYTSNPADEEGFLTSTGRFVTRKEAMQIGADAGQCQIMRRELLSSDINW